MEKSLLFIGTYNVPLTTGDGDIFLGNGKGLYTLEFDNSLGEFGAQLYCVDSPNVSYIKPLPDESSILAVNELENQESLVSKFSYDLQGKLLLTHRARTLGSASCHLEINSNNDTIFVSNYLSGNLTVLNNMELTQLIEHKGSSINIKRQDGPHVHSSLLYNNDQNLLVADLGADALVSYSINSVNNKLTEDYRIDCKKGAGPRTIIKNKSGSNVYVANELNCTISVFKVQDHLLTEFQNISVFEERPDFNGTTSELEFGKDGKYLYAATRGNNILSVFQVDKDGGCLKLIQTVSTFGDNPRSFCIISDYDWLIVANQDSENLTCFKINMDGTLSMHTTCAFPTPVCIRTI